MLKREKEHSVDGDFEVLKEMLPGVMLAGMLGGMLGRVLLGVLLEVLIAEQSCRGALNIIVEQLI